MNTLLVTLKYFLLIAAELTALFLGISALVALLLMYLPREKMQRWMGGKGLWGNFVGALVGSVTPFCACSIIPLALGFLDVGITIGTILSFVIASPLLNPIIFTMLLALMGWKAALAYFVVVFGGAVLFVALLEKAGAAAWVKKMRILSGAGMAIPEMSMLAGIFKKRLVAAIVAVIFLVAVLGGYLFSLVFSVAP